MSTTTTTIVSTSSNETKYFRYWWGQGYTEGDGYWYVLIERAV